MTKIDDIDFVILWVNSADQEWQKKKEEYLPSNVANIDNSDNRYRNWDNLKYWFRGVAKFAPWVRKIHFVTDGQIPEWLNTENDKIHIVNHTDFIPLEVLPLFNSNAIEIGMNHIEGLSDKFVYFNDDMFLTKSINSDYFFKNNLPVDMAGLTRADRKDTVIGRIWLFHTELINKYFNKNDVIGQNIYKWLNPTYGRTFIRTILNLFYKDFKGIVNPHLSYPLLKSDCDEIWNLEKANLLMTQSHRFRQDPELSPLFYRYWHICKGNFIPRKSKGRYFYITDIDIAKKACNNIKKQTYPEICLNDGWEGSNFETARKILNEAFESILPEKCVFEK